MKLFDPLAFRIDGQEKATIKWSEMIDFSLGHRKVTNQFACDVSNDYRILRLCRVLLAFKKLEANNIRHSQSAKCRHHKRFLGRWFIFAPFISNLSQWNLSRMVRSDPIRSDTI